jgi:SAM-dependent methyltransferase
VTDEPDVTDQTDEPGQDLDAAGYDRWFDAPWGSYAFGVERAALLAALGPLHGRRVLDVGCGTGRFTAALEAAGAQVTGLDRDPAMLQLARHRTRARLLRADAHAVPLDDDTFDLAVAITLLEFADRAEQVIAELVRVTRPGGRIAVAALNPHSPWGLVRRRELRRPPWTDACLRPPDELRALLAEHGPVQLHAALYAPAAFAGLTRLGPAIEHLGRPFPRLGAFQLATLDLPERRG